MKGSCYLPGGSFTIHTVRSNPSIVAVRWNVNLSWFPANRFYSFSTSVCVCVCVLCAVLYAGVYAVVYDVMCLLLVKRLVTFVDNPESKQDQIIDR
jgi:hypothetical protein